MIPTEWSIESPFLARPPPSEITVSPTSLASTHFTHPEPGEGTSRTTFARGRAPGPPPAPPRLPSPARPRSSPGEGYPPFRPVESDGRPRGGSARGNRSAHR